MLRLYYRKCKLILSEVVSFQFVTSHLSDSILHDVFSFINYVQSVYAQWTLKWKGTRRNCVYHFRFSTKSLCHVALAHCEKVLERLWFSRCQRIPMKTDMGVEIDTGSLFVQNENKSNKWDWYSLFIVAFRPQTIPNWSCHSIFVCVSFALRGRWWSSIRAMQFT